MSGAPAVGGGGGSGSKSILDRWYVKVGAAVALLLIGAVVGYFVFCSGGDSGTADKPRPAEFLYLDSLRVVAYLAQEEGGTSDSEKFSQRVTRSAEGKIKPVSALELGGSLSVENTLARDVTPTAASEFFSLLEDLKNNDEGLPTVGLGRFPEEIKNLEEGQFVTFRTDGLEAPTYMSPYLALRQKTILRTLFPSSRSVPPGGGRRTHLHRQRKRAERFRKRLGKQPRVIFAIKPHYRYKGGVETPHPVKNELAALEHVRCRAAAAQVEKETQENTKSRKKKAELRELREALARFETQYSAAHGAKPAQAPRSPAEVTEAEERERGRVRYLMPLDARLLTRERSLVKAGGGDFTVVGKVVRIFPESPDDEPPAYVDSDARETWEPALLHAPKKLLCTTDARCRRRVDAIKHDPRLRKTEQHEETREARCQDLAALKDQTEIPVRGAVILPIAIYK